MKRILLIAAFITAYCAHSSAQFTLSDSLVAWYPLDGNDSDYTGHNHDIEFNTATPAKDRFNLPDHAYYMNGSDTISAPSFRLGKYKAITYAAWIKTEGSADFMSVLQFPPHIIWLSRFTQNHFMAAMDGSSWNNSATDESSVSVAGINWHYIVVTNNGDTTFLYVNGRLDNKYPEKLYAHNYDFHIGCLTKTDNGTYFRGYIDDVRIYTRALSAGEINRLFTGSDAGIHYSGDDVSVSVYPNPVVNGSVNLNMPPNFGKAIVQIIDQQGRLITEKDMVPLPEGNVIETRGISHGTYLLRIISADGVWNKQLVVEK